jgi:hypothetical protein
MSGCATAVMLTISGTAIFSKSGNGPGDGCWMYRLKYDTQPTLVTIMLKWPRNWCTRNNPFNSTIIYHHHWQQHYNSRMALTGLNVLRDCMFHSGQNINKLTSK